MNKEAELRALFETWNEQPHNERERRLWAGNYAKEWGFGGITVLAGITGLSRQTVARGIKELASPFDRTRRLGGGRKATLSVSELEGFVHPAGVDKSPVWWICDSPRTIACELERQGKQVSHAAVSRAFVRQGFHLPRGSRRNEKAPAQMYHLHEVVTVAQARGSLALIMHILRRPQTPRNARIHPAPHVTQVTLSSANQLLRTWTPDPVGTRNNIEFSLNALGASLQAMGVAGDRSLIVLANVPIRTCTPDDPLVRGITRLLPGLKVAVYHLPPMAARWSLTRRFVFVGTPSSGPIPIHVGVVSVIGERQPRFQ